jgi:hypothetical protein
MANLISSILELNTQCLACSERNNNKGHDNSKLFIDEVCNDCHAWKALKKVKQADKKDKR